MKSGESISPPWRIAAAAIAIVVLVLMGTVWGLSQSALARAPQTIQVSYQWYREDPGITKDFEVFEVPATVDDGFLHARVIPESYELGAGASWRIMKNFAGGIPAGEEDISAECAYDETTGVLHVPAQRADENLTIIFQLPWTHASHAEHGNFRVSLNDELKRALAAKAPQLLSAASVLSTQSGVADAITPGKEYPLFVDSGPDGMESTPWIYNCDSDVSGAASCAGYPEEEGNYRFYVAFDQWNCELFQILGAVPGRQGHAGTTTTASGGVYYDEFWAEAKWNVAHCVEDVLNNGGHSIPTGGWVRVDSVTGSSVNFTFYIDCAGPDGSNYQDIMGSGSLEIPFGELAIVKSSALPQISDENACYSIAGAQYGVYHDEACTDLAGTITTDTQGSGRLGDLRPGNYWAKELSAAPGYSLDLEAHAVEVQAGATAELAVSDIPQSNPIALLVSKLDAATSNASPLGDASLANAQFKVEYYDGYYETASQAAASGSPVRSWLFQTDDAGQVAFSEEYLVSGDSLYHQSDGTAAIPLGSVVIREVQAPQGYMLDDGSGNAPTAWCLKITADDASAESTYVFNPPLQPDSVKRGGIVIGKADAEQYHTPDGDYWDYAQGDASFTGAAFDVYNRSAHAIWADLNSDGATQENEMFAPGAKIMTIETSYNASLDAYTATTGDKRLPFGTYEIVESRAPQGYTQAGAVNKTVEIREEGQTVQLVKAQGMLNEVARGGVQVIKGDRELGLSEAVGGAEHRVLESDGHLGTSLACIEFTITNISDHGVMIGNTYYAPGDVVGTISTAWNSVLNAYTAQTPTDMLPYGTYSIAETASNESYLMSDGAARTFEVRSNGSVVTQDTADAPLVWKDQVVRNDLRLQKKAGDTGQKLAGIPFLITNLSTGEAHVAATDRNGSLNTAANWHSHAANTNVNDVLLNRDTITQTDTEENSGTWFGRGEDGSMCNPNDELGALPFGEYSIEELRCEANAGYALWRDTFNVSRDKSVVEFDIDLGTIINEPEPEIPVELEPKIATTASDKETGEHSTLASGTVTIVDKVEYANLEPGTSYVLRGRLMNRESGEELLVNGAPVTQTQQFSPLSPYGSISLEFSFDASNLAGTSVVVFEELVIEENVIAQHADISNEQQTVTINPVPPVEAPPAPTMGTSAVDKSSKTHEGQAREDMAIVDTVSYSGCGAGNAYTLMGRLMDKETGQPVLDAYGHEVTAEKTFVAQDTSGTVDIEFSLDSSLLAGHELVVFESMYFGGVKIMEHADLADNAQAVRVVEVLTRAKNPATGESSAMAAQDLELVDNVSYKGLSPQKTYKLLTSLALADTGELLTQADGSPIIGETVFTPTDANGETAVTSTIDATDLGGRTLVFFERLADSDGNVIATHEDISNKEQSIDLKTPETPTVTTGSTSAASGQTLPKTGDHVAPSTIAVFIVLAMSCAAGVMVSVWRRWGKATTSSKEDSRR